MCIRDRNDIISAYKIYDIRNETAYKECHIKGAELFTGDIEKFKIPKDKKVLIYDQTGSSASNTIKRLKNMGIENVYMLDGGMLYLRKYAKYLKLDLVCEEE